MGESHTDKAKAKATDKPAAAGGTTLTPLKFVPFTSQIDLPFYAAFFASKLDHDKLSESARPVYGVYEAARPGTDPHDSGRMLIQGNALTSDEVALESVRADGIIKNSNTLEAFKSVDRKEALDNASRQIWDAIKDGTIYSVPSLLTHFVIISYADLKKYKMMYWFCYPALHSDPQWNQIGNVGHMTGPECNTLVDEVNTWKLGVDKRQRGFFLAKKVRRQPRASDESAATWSEEDRRNRFRWTIGSLDQFETGFFNDADEQDRFVSFVDPSSHPEAAGWPLRNLLVLVRQRFHLSQLQVLCYRDVHSLRHSARSIILRLGLDSVEAMEMSEMPKATGWERNQAGLLRPVAMSLRESMDPRHIAQQSVDLNVKLMKWRIAPGLNLDVIKNTKCLLLGAGTLGSYVSRNLMGWGVRKISFVDYGSVSFSNPVRQPLFNYKDCLDGGARKASRAADALKEIFPGVDSEGHVLSVPMLGHPVDKDSRAGFDKLKTLIDEHDAIFLLMDTRESRWLPTVMGKAAGKIVMNAALGFDSYVVLRHGLQPADGSDATLGCYFCNDVVAPGDKDLTLDQQCTTTRPGIAAIASAQLVELLISLLQHPLGGHAPAPVSRDASNGDYERDPPDHPLGIVPHQIRGFLGTFRNVIIKGESYPCCSACSKPIVSAYKADGWNFVKRALESKDYVSELSGLAEVQRKALAMEDDLEWDEDEDEDEEGDKGDQGDKEVDEEAVLL